MKKLKKDIYLQQFQHLKLSGENAKDLKGGVPQKAYIRENMGLWGK